ncbi:hypothetical protein [Amycolatopsis thailandensis]|uniref:hypothetical protein n=1 Tax=Amycolatopsis thailandensis TaxID=589330 RepID=UPI003628F797
MVDLSAVTYLSMEAVAPLLAITSRCAAENQPLRVIPSHAVRPKLITLGLGTGVPLEPDAGV